ncbi:hypothetical protein IGJ02_000174 [Enterococcus sp. DIV0724b]|uniref:WxL domain-containing protein n=1 Tax=Enterococcus sp. DIV0724b TaxID=2774694 RepID=UPI003D2FF1E8
MKKIATSLLLSSIVLGSLSISTFSAYAEDVAQLGSEGSIKYFENDETVPPVDPEDPDPTDPVDPGNPDPEGPDPEPGTDGPLSLDYVPHLYFGLNQITNKDTVYDAYATPLRNAEGGVEKYVPNYVQVTDERGEYTGWTLTVAQKDEFTSGSGATLGNATQISLTQPNTLGVWEDATTPSVVANPINLLPNNEAQTVFAAAAAEGEGTWVNSWGTVEEDQRYAEIAGEEQPQLQATQVNKAVQLSVPGSVKKQAERYVTNLDWVLSDTPAQ